MHSSLLRLGLVPAHRDSATKQTSQHKHLQNSGRQRRRLAKVYALEHEEASPEQPQERFIDPLEILREARAEAEDFLFTDDSDEPVWALERHMEARPPAAANQPQPVTAQTADILSAYSSEQGFRDLSVDELQERLADEQQAVKLLDVRTPEEFATGHVPGAINAPLDQLTDLVNSGQLPAADDAVVVICQSGRRSAQAVVKLSRVHRYSNIANVRGGTLEWIAAGYTVE